MPSKTYWLQRISYEGEVSHKLFEKGYLTIGWGKFIDGKVLKHTIDRNDFRKFMDRKKIKTRNRWCLWYFAQFKVGDEVLVPLNNGKFQMCKVLETIQPITKLLGLKFKNELNKPVIVDENGVRKENINEKPYDIGFVVKVEKITNEIPRSFALPVLKDRMKIYQTNSNISDLVEAIETAKATKKIASIHDAIEENVAKIFHQQIKERIDSSEMEKLVKWYFEKRGASIVNIPAKNEPGKENGADADVVAEFNDLDVIFYVQVKKHKGETDGWAVNQIVEYKEQKQDESNEYTYIPWVVSSAEYSEEAIKLAKDSRVRLIGGLEFSKMLLNVGISGIDDIKYGKN